MCMEALRRQNQDAHAACELLRTFHERLQAAVASELKASPADVDAIARMALESCQWDHNEAPVFAKRYGRLVASASKRSGQDLDVAVVALQQTNWDLDRAVKLMTNGDLAPPGELDRAGNPRRPGGRRDTKSRAKPVVAEEESEEACVIA